MVGIPTIIYTSSRTSSSWPCTVCLLFRFTTTHNFIITLGFALSRGTSPTDLHYQERRPAPYSCFFAASPVSPFLLSEEPGAGFGEGTAAAAGADAGAGAAGCAEADIGAGTDARDDADAGGGGIAATDGPGRGGIDGGCRPGGADADAVAPAD